MNNTDVAATLGRLATMLEIEGANPFRVRAYREAARIVGEHGEPITSVAAREGELEALPGIGKDLAGKIRELATTGTLPLYIEMEARVPPGVLALTGLQGLGPKRVKTLMDLGIRGPGDLEQAANEGRLRDLPGFGEKVEQNVLKALVVASTTTGRILLAGAWPVAHTLADHVRAVPGVEQVEIAGSFRRRKETVGDLDLLACGGSTEAVMQAFVTHPDVLEVLGRGETKSSVRMRSGLQVDLRHVPAESFGAALVYFTGSKEHNIELRRIAIENGLSLNEYGLKRGERTETARTEDDVYRALGLEWIPPELREARGEIEMARNHQLPELVELADLRGDLHMHTDRTDGREPLETMVQAAKARGYEYVAITDHSKALAMIGGFDEARVRQSADEIAAVRRAVPGIEVLHGLEVDILADGALDLDDEALDTLDWVVISLHSRLDMEPALMTERVLRALDHPAVCVMGHPTSRIIGTRSGAAYDFERVFERAAANGVLMEINAQPDRLDLSDINARLAREKGVAFTIDTDAHSVAHLSCIPFGVFMARRAGLTSNDVLNTLPYAGFREAIEQRRGRRRAMPRVVAAAAAHAGSPVSAGAPDPERQAMAPAAPEALQTELLVTPPPRGKRPLKNLGPLEPARPRASRARRKPATGTAPAAGTRPAAKPSTAKPARPASRKRTR